MKSQVNDRKEGHLECTEWLENAKSIDTDIIGVIHSHLDPIFNYFLSPTINRKMEGINNHLKLINRQA